MHEEMMVGFRRRRTQSRSGWGTPRPPLVASDVVSSRLLAGPVATAAIIGCALGLTAVADAANPDAVNLNPRTPGTQFGVIVNTHAQRPPPVWWRAIPTGTPAASPNTPRPQG
jgi:hypothetical protein